MIIRTMTVLATATVLAIASAAHAGSEKDPTDVGGFHIGSLGQPMGAPYAWGAGAPWSTYRSYAYAPRGHVSRRWHYEP
jgi:hypothetical protein